MINTNLYKININFLQQKKTSISNLVSMRNQLDKVSHIEEHQNEYQIIDLLLNIDEYLMKKQTNIKIHEQKIDEFLTKLNGLYNEINNKNQKFNQGKRFLTLKVSTYQICMIILCLQQKSFNHSSQYRLNKLNQFDQTMQQLMQLVAESQHNYKIVISQLFGLSSLLEYYQYNIHCNQQYKYDEGVQIDFLYLMAKIKLATLNCEKLNGKTQNQSQKLIKFQIFIEGKETLKKCKNLCERSSNIKCSDMIKKISKIQRYCCWAEQKQNQQKQQKQILNKKASNIQDMAMITPVKKNLNSSKDDQKMKDIKIHTPIYMLLSTDKKQSNGKNSIISEAQEEILDQICIEIIINNLLAVQDSIRSKKKGSSLLYNKNNTQEMQKSQQFRDTIQKFLQLCNDNNNKKNNNLQSNIVNESILSILKMYFMETRSEVRKSIQNNSSFLNIIKCIKKCIAQVQDSEKSQYPNSQNEKSQKQELKKFQKQNTKNVQQSKITKLQPQIQSKISQISTKKVELKSKISKKSYKNLSVDTQNPIKQKYQVCKNGQFLTKYNFNNSSHSIKFVKIHNDKLLWADSKQQINDSSQCKFSKIDGVVYGSVTKKMVQQIQKNKLQPWRCFSVLYKDRTIDFYCQQNQYDVFFWLTGISYHLRTYYTLDIKFSTGKILWKKILMKIKQKYLKVKTKQQKLKKFYLGRDNAQAIINFSKSAQNKV